MARAYTLHVPAGAGAGDPDALEDAELVDDGFSWGAFVFTFLWFFLNRLWLAGLAVMVAVIGSVVALQALWVPGGAAFLAYALLAFLIGLEANNLRRWTLRRRKPAVDVVTASDLDEAEAKAFSRWLAAPGRSGAAVSPVRSAAASYRAEPVIGLFPDAERYR